MATRQTVMLADVAGGRDNNFNLIRMIAASGVLVSHAFPMALGYGTPEPLEATTGHALGWICVAIFFAISGFLITRSFERTSRLENWFSARIMRLFPALIVVTGLTMLIYGPIFTVLPLGDYFSQLKTWTYVPRNVSLAFLQYALPGVFRDHPLPYGINGSLWTLFYEVLCYLAVFMLGVLGILRSRKLFAAICVLAIVAYFVTGLAHIEPDLPDKLAKLRRLAFPFLIGMMFYVWRERIPLSWLGAFALAGLSVATHGTALFEGVFITAIAYGTFVLAYRPGGVLRRYNDLGDYSYGMYVYAFPVQQAVVAVAGAMTPLANIAYAFPITLACAIASWKLVEEPSMEHRKWFGGILGRLRRGEPAKTIAGTAPRAE